MAIPRSLFVDSTAASLMRAYGALACLALAAWALPWLGGIALGIVVALLAAPAIPAAWHRVAVRRLERLHTLAPGHWLYGLAARRLIGHALVAALAVLATACVLLQTPFFGVLEWSLLAVAPLLYAGLRALCAARVAPLFSRDVYARSAGSRLARALTFLVLATAWAVGRFALATRVDAPLAEIAYGLQMAWPHERSALVRWAVDAGAWGQAIMDTLGRASGATWWRVLLAVLVLPVTTFGYATAVSAGAFVPVAEWRRMLARRLVDDDVPAPSPRRRISGHAIGACIAGVLVAVVVAQTDAKLAREGRWLALRALPSCERIGGTAYEVGTLAKVAAYLQVMEEGLASRGTSACARVTELERVAASAVDAYLDWYWSLGAEWTRVALTITGDAESLLELKFDRLVARDPRVANVLGLLEADHQYIADVTTSAHAGIDRLLASQRLVLDERQCRVATERAGLDVLPRYDGTRTRLLAGAASGVVAGAFAGALTARAMSRASMQVASRVLGKAVARQGMGRLGAAAAGAATGAAAGSVVPGLGTAAGAVAGTVTGLAVGVGVDVALLAAEEKLTRPQMRQDLLAAVQESLAPLRTAFGCAGH